MILHKVAVRCFSRSSQFGCSNKIKDLLENAAIGGDAKPENEGDFWSTSDYPQGAVLNRRRDQSKKSRRPLRDPRDTSIILFPGQGSQYVGMAKNLEKIPEARDMFEMASGVLGYDLLRLCNEGPQQKLDQTIYAQPAIAVTSLASLEKLKEERPNAIENCVATAGFSLGEITALIFAGAMPFDQGVKLIQVRAEAMHAAGLEHPSGMATVIYGPDSDLGGACVKAKEWCIERGVENPDCRVANYLFPHCKVVAGSLEALEFIEKNAKQYKLRKVKRLPVSGAFHTNIMESALDPFYRALKKIKIEMPLISVHSNVDGRIYKNVNQILRQLPLQIIRPVRWEQLLHIIYERPVGDCFPRTYECAPGNTLTTILKQVNAKAWDTTFIVDTGKREQLERNQAEQRTLREQKAEKKLNKAEQ